MKKKLNLKNSNNVPIQAPHTVFRKKAIENIRTKFLSNYLDFESKELQEPLVAIVGGPLQGKTELAKQYAFTCRNHYRHIFFVQKDHWEKAYRDFAKAWGLFPDKKLSDCHLDIVIKRVHEVLDSRSLKKSLIIFDDIDSSFLSDCLKGELPKNTQILITTRDRQTPWENPIDLSQDTSYTLTQQEGLDILRNWVGPEGIQDKASEDIVTTFRNAPFAIAQAGRAISKYNISMENYLQILDANKKIASATHKKNDLSKDLTPYTWRAGIEKLDR